jgi:hypothetical protein
MINAVLDIPKWGTRTIRFPILPREGERVIVDGCDLIVEEVCWDEITDTSNAPRDKDAPPKTVKWYAPVLVMKWREK